MTADKSTEIDVLGRAEYANAQKAKKAWLLKLAELRKVIIASDENNEQKERLKKLLDDHEDQIKRIKQTELEKTLLAQQTALKAAITAELKVEASRENILQHFNTMQTMQTEYVKLHIAESLLPAIMYLNEVYNKHNPTGTNPLPSPDSIIGIQNTAPNRPAASTPKIPNYAEQLIQNNITEIRNKDTKPDSVTTYRNNTLYSNSARDAVATAIAAGWKEEVSITTIPKNNPKLILNTIAAFIMNGVHVTVPGDVRSKMFRQLSFDVRKQFTKQFFTLMHLSDLIEEIRKDPGNTAFDDGQQSLFSKLMLKASEFKDAETLHAEILDIFTSTDESRQIIMNAIRTEELNGLDLRKGSTEYDNIKDYILASLPANKRTDMKTLYATEEEDKEKKADREMVNDFKEKSNGERVKIIIELMKDYKKNKATLDQLLALNTLTPDDRTTIMIALHNYYFTEHAQADTNFDEIISKDAREKKQPSIKMSRIVPKLVKPMSAEAVLAATKALREEASNEFYAKPAAEEGGLMDVPQEKDHEKCWKKFLALRNFVSSYEGVNEQLKFEIIKKFKDELNKLSDEAKALHYVKFAGSCVTEYMRSNKLALAGNNDRNIETQIIQKYMEMYRQHPCPLGLQFITTHISNIIKNMSNPIKDALVDTLKFDIFNLTPEDEAILEILAKNKIPKASPNEIYYAQLDTDDEAELSAAFENRAKNILSKADEKTRIKIIRSDIEAYAKLPTVKLKILLRKLADLKAGEGADQEKLAEIYQELIKHRTKIAKNFAKEIGEAANEGDRKTLLSDRIQFYVALKKFAPNAQAESEVEDKFFVDEFTAIVRNHNNSEAIIACEGLAARAEPLLPLNSGALDEVEEKAELTTEDTNQYNTYLYAAQEIANRANPRVVPL